MNFVEVANRYILEGARFAEFGTFPGNCFVGMGATAGAGMILKYLFSDDAVYDFQNHLDQASQFLELKANFLEVTQFIRGSCIVIASAFFIWLFLIISVFRYCRNLKKKIEQSVHSLKKRADEFEHVIEAILRDNETVDAEQLNFFKNEIQQQQKAFKDFIDLKTVDLEGKISSAVNVCNKAKANVHADLKKTQALTVKINDMDVNIGLINKMIEKTKIDTNELEKDVSNFKLKAKSHIELLETEINEKCSKLDSHLTSQEVDISKCSNLLIQSQVLLEAAISKFEDIMSISDTDDNDSRPSRENTERLISCLKKAIDIKDYFDNGSNFGIANCDITNDRLFEEKCTKIETDPKKNAINSLLYELMNRLKNVEESMNIQSSSIEMSNTKIKSLQSTTSEELSELKVYTDEWITSWVSVIYGLFNTSFLHLEKQFYGVDCIEYTSIYELASNKFEKDSKLLFEITGHTKNTCLKILKEVNLYIFGYYLVQKTGTTDDLIDHCSRKIDEELDELFEYFEGTFITKSDATETKKNELKNIFYRFRHDIAIDLKTDTKRFNLLVKQNLDDFYVIHDTMRQLSAENSNKKRDAALPSNFVDLSDDSNPFHSDDQKSYLSSDGTSITDSHISLKPFNLRSSFK